MGEMREIYLDLCNPIKAVCYSDKINKMWQWLSLLMGKALDFDFFPCV